MKRQTLPMNLQFFAEPPANEPPVNNPPANPSAGDQNPPANNPPAIDYAKIQQMLDGTLAAKEDTALKAYFKQQGLSQQEAEQAMADFKQQKAANQPDVQALQAQSAQAQQQVLQAQIENKALLMHQELGVDLNTIPYLMKLADLNNVVVEGSINDDKLKEALNKVLTDVPQLKIQQEQAQQGFRQVGAAGQSGQQSNAEVTKPVATKRWNRFNN